MISVSNVVLHGVGSVHMKLAPHVMHWARHHVTRIKLLDGRDGDVTRPTGPPDQLICILNSESNSHFGTWPTSPGGGEECSLAHAAHAHHTCTDHEAAPGVRSRVLTTHCTRGAAKASCLSWLYLSMLPSFSSSPPSCWFLSPLCPPSPPPCPPSHRGCSGPALSLVGRIQATHAHVHARAHTPTRTQTLGQCFENTLRHSWV